MGILEMPSNIIKQSFGLLIALFGISCANLQDNISNSETSSDGPHSQLLRVAESMKKAGDCGTAVKFYGDIVFSEPENLQATIGFAQCLTDLKRYTEASEVLNHFLLNQPHNTQIRVELGKVYIAGHNPKMAFEEFVRIPVNDPQITRALNGLGICNDFLGQHQEAQNAYKKALEKVPGHTGILSNLGLSYILDGKYEQGIAILEPLAKRSQATPRERQNLALAYGLSGNIAKAAQLYSIDLDDNAVRNNIAYLHILRSSPHASHIEAIYPNAQKKIEAVPTIDHPQPIMPSKPLIMQPLSSDKVSIKKSSLKTVH
jgi:Flp pilus assembly protein TadD